MLHLLIVKVGDAREIDAVMPMYKLLEYSHIYFKTSGSLWQYYRDKPVLNNNDAIIDFPADSNNSISFKFKENRENRENRK